MAKIERDRDRETVSVRERKREEGRTKNPIAPANETSEPALKVVDHLEHPTQFLQMIKRRGALSSVFKCSHCYHYYHHEDHISVAKFFFHLFFLSFIFHSKKVTRFAILR